ITSGTSIPAISPSAARYCSGVWSGLTFIGAERSRLIGWGSIPTGGGWISGAGRGRSSGAGWGPVGGAPGKGCEAGAGIPVCWNAARRTPASLVLVWACGGTASPLGGFAAGGPGTVLGVKGRADGPEFPPGANGAVDVGGNAGGGSGGAGSMVSGTVGRALGGRVTGAGVSAFQASSMSR